MCKKENYNRNKLSLRAIVPGGQNFAQTCQIFKSTVLAASMHNDHSTNNKATVCLPKIHQSFAG